MAESTVSGPFRSENGFQQLDENGEWVPVTGGGGGGGVTSVVAGSGVSVSSPTGAVTIANTGVTSIIAGSNVSVNQSTGAVTISATGGGGGGAIVVELGDGGLTSPYPDNRYSNNKLSPTPSGPTAGNIIQLPEIQIGQSYYINLTSTSAASAWRLQAPLIAGTDVSLVMGRVVFSIDADGWGINPTYISLGATDTFYIYGQPSGAIGSLELRRMANVSFMGSTIAVFSPTNGVFLSYEDYEMSTYPYTTV